MTDELHRRRELARLTKPDLIDLIIDTEADYQDLRASASRQLGVELL